MNQARPPSPILSPSKARQAAARAQDWAYVTAWLEKKYAPSRVPKFEHIPEVLQSLLALAAANEEADEEAELVHRAREKELELYENQAPTNNNPTQAILSTLPSHLSTPGSNALTSLATASTLLGTLSPTPISLATSLLFLTKSSSSLSHHAQAISSLQTHLQTETATLEAQLQALSSQSSEQLTSTLQASTAQFNRETKQISTKIAEYKERSSALERARMPGPIFEAVGHEEAATEASQARVKALEERLLAFQGLPPDLEAAKGELARVQGEFVSLQRRRNDLFEEVMASR